MSDLISREALKREFETLFYNDCGDFVRTERLIDNAPTVEQSSVIGEVISFVERDSRPKGKWEFVQYDANPNIGNWHCSKCRYIQFTMDRPKYCPNCGAQMVR